MEASAAEAASSSADLETQLHARCHAAESRARVLHAQLAAAAEAIEVLQELEFEGGGRERPAAALLLLIMTARTLSSDRLSPALVALRRT